MALTLDVSLGAQPYTTERNIQCTDYGVFYFLSVFFMNAFVSFHLVRCAFFIRLIPSQYGVALLIVK